MIFRNMVQRDLLQRKYDKGNWIFFFYWGRMTEVREKTFIGIALKMSF